MAIKPVIQLGNSLLREKSLPVTDISHPQVQETMQDLLDTLKDLQIKHQRGGGLAAPQIGCLQQIICCHVDNETTFLINPCILNKSAEMFEVWDFCFSANAAFLAPLKRHREIEVEFFSGDGEKQIKTYRDYWSELVQHEIDHLHGRLFIDLIKDADRIVMASESKNINKSN